MPAPKTILVLGVGNLLLSDEGVGIHVVNELQKTSHPEHVEVVDGGTGGFELLNHFYGKKKVIIVDAMQGDAAPGTIFRCLPDDLNLQVLHTYSSHQNSLVELLHFSKTLTPPPEVVIFGIVPKDIQGVCTSLSGEIAQQVPKIVEAILKEID